MRIVRCSRLGTLRVRTCLAVVLCAAGLALMVHLLMMEQRQLWHLTFLGSAIGFAVGLVRWSWRGAAIGLLVGAMLGTAAPILYLPFWLYFTLPPHPEYDL